MSMKLSNLFRRRRRDTLLDKVVRLGAFLFVCNLITSAFALRHVHAQVEDLMLSVGSRMMQLGQNIEHAAPRTLRLNGAAVRLRVETLPNATLEQVLDTFEGRCRSVNGRFHEQLSKAELATPLDDAQLDFLDGVIRAEDEARASGMVACLDVGDEKTTPSMVLERAQRFLQSGDTAELGHLRYVTAEQDGKNVFMVMLWTDGPLNVYKMFPEAGDAEGVELEGLPRPPHSRRLISAWEEGQGPALNMYTTEHMDGAALDEHYRTALPKLGWTIMTKPGTAPKDLRGMMVMRDGVTAIIATQTDADGHGITSLVPMDASGAAEAFAGAP
jgi:hypothetical protein